MTSNLLRIVAAAALLAQGGDWVPARADYRWSFPRDHWAHPEYRTEWWYFTGHLAAAGDTTPRFGYQFTFFRIGVLPRRVPLASAWETQSLVMGHAAITDLRSGTHRFSELLVRAAAGLAGLGAPGDSTVVWSRAPAGTPGRWTLRWNGAGFRFNAHDSTRAFGFELDTRPTRPLVFHGPNGFSRKGPGPTSASLYYSSTRLATRGSLSLDARTFEVHGESWMDREFFTASLSDEQTGWDWFSLQLSDGRDLMLFRVREATGRTSWAAGTIAAPGRPPRPLEREDFEIRPLATWRSPVTGAEYPRRWAIAVPGEEVMLEVEAAVADQENRSRLLPRLFYWEGSVTVRNPGGAPAGRGYAELVGYGSGLRPAMQGAAQASVRHPRR
jgi:predicted secreted hydrolase